MNRNLSDVQFVLHDPDPDRGSQVRLDAVRGGDVVGGVGWLRELSWEGPRGKITGIYVEKEHQRQGIATALWNEARSREPRVHHSNSLTDEGRAWKESLDSRNTGE